LLPYRSFINPSLQEKDFFSVVERFCNLATLKKPVEHGCKNGAALESADERGV
jgi:hypothetical protein